MVLMRNKMWFVSMPEYTTVRLTIIVVEMKDHIDPGVLEVTLQNHTVFGGALLDNLIRGVYFD